jgi:hypothetical protein
MWFMVRTHVVPVVEFDQKVAFERLKNELLLKLRKSGRCSLFTNQKTNE